MNRQIAEAEEKSATTTTNIMDPAGISDDEILYQDDLSFYIDDAITIDRTNTNMNEDEEGSDATSIWQRGAYPTSKCPLCSTEDRASYMIFFVGIFLVAFACFMGSKKSRWGCRHRGQDSNSNIAPRQGNAGANNDNSMRELDMSRILNEMGRLHIVRTSLVTTKAISAPLVMQQSIRLELSKTDSLGALERKDRTSESCSCTSLESSSHADIDADEEAGLPTSSNNGTDNNVAQSEAKNVDANPCFVLESTGLEIDTCAICIESYKENDVIAYSKTQNCSHVFHKKCIHAWLKNNGECPCCRCPYLQVGCKT